MKVLDAISGAVRTEGVDHVFHAPDEVTVFVAQALHEEGVHIVRPRHEQNAVVMADGYARASGNVGVCLIGAGPALAQTGTGLVTALRRRSSVLVLLGQIPRNRGANKRFDAQRFVESLGARYLELQSARTALADVGEAFRLVRLGRGPVVLGVGDPHLLLQDDVPLGDRYLPAIDVAAHPLAHPVEPDPESDRIQEAAAILADAQRPVIIAGRGAIEARKEMIALADRIGALLATSIQARTLFRGHPRDVGAIGTLGTSGAAELFTQADCVLGVGVALNPYQTVPAGAKVIHVDRDPEQIGAYTRVDVGIVSDARATVRAMERALAEAEITARSAWMAESMQPQIEAARAAAVVAAVDDNDADSVALPLSVALSQLDDILPSTRFVTTDAGLFLGFAIDHITVSDPVSWMWTNDFGSIGLSFPMGMGAAFGRPGAHVAVFAGDGGFMMSLQEIETAVRERVPVTVVVLNNGGHAAEERFLASLDKPLQFSRYGDVDFAAVARAFGATGVTVSAAGGLDEAAREIANRQGPIVIDVKVREDEPHRLLEGSALTAARP